MGDCELLRRACPRSFVAPFLQRRVRPDGRRPSEVRGVEIHAGCPYGGPQTVGPQGSPTGAPLAAAHASSAVRAGGDWWFAAIECKLGPPVPLPPRSSSSSSSSKEEYWGGRVVVVVDMPRICGCPQGDTLGTAREVSRHLTALLNDPSIFDCSQLAFSGVPPAAAAAAAAADSSNSIRFYWHIEIRVVCLQFGGSIFRAPALAAVAALGVLRIPDVEWDGERKWWAIVPPFTPAAAAAADTPGAARGEKEDRIVVRGQKVVLQSLPICITACQVLQNTWVFDPTDEERQLGPLVAFVSPAPGAPLTPHKLQGAPLDAVLLQQLQQAAAAAVEETRQQLARALDG